MIYDKTLSAVPVIKKTMMLSKRHLTDDTIMAIRTENSLAGLSIERKNSGGIIININEDTRKAVENNRLYAAHHDLVDCIKFTRDHGCDILDIEDYIQPVAELRTYA